MIISVLTIVDRGAPAGVRCCEGCRQPAEVLREVRVPYSNAGAYWRDLCDYCIDDLRRMPRLPEQRGAQDKVKADAAWEQALHRLRTSSRVGGQQAQPDAVSYAAGMSGPIAPRTRSNRLRVGGISKGEEDG